MGGGAAAEEEAAEVAAATAAAFFFWAAVAVAWDVLEEPGGRPRRFGGLAGAGMRGEENMGGDRSLSSGGEPRTLFKPCPSCSREADSPPAFMSGSRSLLSPAPPPARRERTVEKLPKPSRGTCSTRVTLCPRRARRRAASPCSLLAAKIRGWSGRGCGMASSRCLGAACGLRARGVGLQQQRVELDVRRMVMVWAGVRAAPRGNREGAGG